MKEILRLALAKEGIKAEPEWEIPKEGVTDRRRLLRADLRIPEWRIAIEVYRQGGQHEKPIFGLEKFNGQEERDIRKRNELLALNYKIVYVTSPQGSEAKRRWAEVVAKKIRNGELIDDITWLDFRSVG